MSADKGVVALAIGVEPRVDLLPLEVRKERRAKVVRRRLGLSVVCVLLLVLLGSGASTALSLQAQQQLLDENERTGELLVEQAKYIEVRKVQEKVGLVQAARQVGVSTEIDWKKYLEGVQGTLPGGVTIESVKIDSASPLAIYSQPTAPLQGERVATISFAAKSAVLPDVPTWLKALAALPGYADSLPGSVVLDETTSTYTVDITMHVNEDAFLKRFQPEEK